MRLLFALMAALYFSGEAVAASVRYEVTLIPTNRSLHVEMVVSGAPGLAEWAKDPEWGWTPGETSEPVIVEQSDALVRMVYVSTTETAAERAYKPFLDASRWRTPALAFIREPKLPGETVSNIELCIRIPSGWRLASSFGTGDGCKVVADMNSLLHSIYMAGAEIELREFAIDGTQITISQAKDYPVGPDQVRTAVHDVVAASREYLGDRGAPRVFFALDLLPAGVSAPGFNLTSTQASSTLLLDAADRTPQQYGFWGTYAHEFLHSWTPHAFGGGAQESLGPLFSEGLTNYLAYRIAHRSGLIDDTQFAEAISSYYLENRVLWQPARSEQRGALAYSQGMLAALALDFHIRRATTERSSLRDFMRTLIDRHGGKETLDQASFLALLAEIGGAGAADLYVRLGDTSRPVDWQRELAGTGIVLPALSDEEVNNARRGRTNVVRFAPRGRAEQRRFERWRMDA